MKKVGFIDYYLDEWHANNYPEAIARASGGEFKVAYAYAQIDSPIGGMTTAQWCEKYGIERCSTIEEVVEKSDVLVVLSPDNCEMHESLCQIPLASGKRCYVDKTFAPDGATARRIFANAEAHGTPCFSASSLRYVAEYKAVDPAGIEAISSWGPAFGGGNGFEVYAIHQLEPIFMLMPGAPEKVLFQPGKGWYTFLISFADGRQASMTGFAEGSPFMMNICKPGGNQVVTVESDYFEAFIAELVDFFRTGQEKVPHETTIAIMATRAAGFKAMEAPGTWVAVNE